jgi:hypothetical protein
VQFVKLAVASAVLSLVSSAPSWATGLVITPTFDPLVPGALQTVINNAISVYEGLYTDPMTVTIYFRYQSTRPNGSGGFVAWGPNALAQSNYTMYSNTWATYINALKNDPNHTANDNTAIANLPSSPLATDLDPSSADGRALGEATPGATKSDGSCCGGTFDGVVSLNSGQTFQFDRTGGPVIGAYDATRVVEHEIDEVLGLGSILPASTDFTGGTAYRPQDLFRYSSPHTRQNPLNGSGAATSYFSIDDGVTNLVGFNQDSTGDYGDWLSTGCPALVQDAFSCSGQFADVSATSPEGVNLDVIGYDLATAAPEPTSMILMASGILLVAAFRRRAGGRLN